MTPEQVRWVAHLARLELSEAELDTMTRQLTSIVDFVNQLQAVPTEDVEPMAHALPLQNVFRADQPRPSLSPDEALANAPDRQGNFFGVPAIFDF